MRDAECGDYSYECNEEAVVMVVVEEDVIGCIGTCSTIGLMLVVSFFVLVLLASLQTMSLRHEDRHEIKNQSIPFSFE
jgi:hypothetical protein